MSDIKGKNNPKVVIEADKQRLMGIIKAEREKRNLSQADLAKMLDISQGRVAQLESKQGTLKVSYDILLSTLEKLGYFYRIIPSLADTKEEKKESHLVIHGRLNRQIAGFSMENKEANQGGHIKILVKGFFSSKDIDFYKLADNIAEAFLFSSIKGLMRSSIASLGHFVILLYKDGKYDLHLGMPSLIEGLSKKGWKAGDPVSYSDIASIRRVRFPTIAISPDCGIIYHFSEGYRHGLFIDLTPLTDGHIDVDALERELAVYFQQLSYETHFKDDDVIAKMAEDGWFRFAAIPKELFEQLYSFYADPSIKDKASIIRNHFTADRISEMVQRWKLKPMTKNHQQFFDSAINSFRSGDDIATISTLYPRIEGVLFDLFGNKKENLNLPWLLKQLKEAGTNKAGTRSLLFPRQFQKYLDNYLCQNFDLSSGKMTFSRHSYAHGVSEENDYTRDKAIIGFMIMEQIFYYI